MPPKRPQIARPWRSRFVRDFRGELRRLLSSRNIRGELRRLLSSRDVRDEFRRLFSEEIERAIRSVVPEEIPRLLANHVPPASRLSINQDKEIKYRLHFLNKLRQPIFTFNEIEAENGMKIQIAIMDSNLKEVISSNTLSSVKVEVVVVNGDFGGDGQKTWTEEEFKDNVVPQRDGKGSLLTGELVIKLSNGIGYLASAKFTDNSSWTRPQMFRLALKILTSENIKERVLEGRSEPFRVKDRRLESSQKHYTPSLTDEVWRLNNVMKDGKYHKRLVDGGIHTVQQFLQAFAMNAEKLRSLLGDKENKAEIPNKKWQGIVAHAQKCPLGNDLYSYNVLGKNVVLIFNSIYVLLGAKLDGHYHSMGDLLAFQQNFLDEWKKLAFENSNDIHIMVDNLSQAITRINVPSLHGSSLLDQQITYSGENHDEATTHVGLLQQPIVPHNEHSHVLPPMSSSFQEPEVSNALSVDSIPMHLPTAIAFPGLVLPEPQNSDHPATYTDEAAADIIFQPFQDVSNEQDFNQCQPPAYFHAYGVSHMNDTLNEHPFRFESCTSTANGYMPDDEGKEMMLEYLNACFPAEPASTYLRKWVKLIAVLKFRLSIRKHLAARRTGIVHLNVQTEMPSSCLGNLERGAES